MNLKIYKKNLLLSCLIGFIYIVVSCSSDTGNQNKENTIEKAEVKEPDSGFSREGIKLLYTLPTPLEFAHLVKKSKLSYNNSILNSPENVSKYSTSFQKSLNLGIYGADLGYSFLYGQSQSGLKYMNACKSLANDLSISGAFEHSIFQRVENNINNNDSVIKIVTDAFGKADFYLKDNNRNSIAALILAGGWIEAAYMATQLVKDKPEKEIITRIGEQKISLDVLLELLNLYKNDNNEITSLVEKLNMVKDGFNEVNINYNYKPKTVDTFSRVMTINTTSKVNIANDQLKNITEKIAALRTHITS